MGKEHGPLSSMGTSVKKLTEAAAIRPHSRGHWELKCKQVEV